MRSSTKDSDGFEELEELESWESGGCEGEERMAWTLGSIDGSPFCTNVRNGCRCMQVCRMQEMQMQMQVQDRYSNRINGCRSHIDSF